MPRPSRNCRTAKYAVYDTDGTVVSSFCPGATYTIKVCPALQSKDFAPLREGLKPYVESQASLLNSTWPTAADVPREPPVDADRHQRRLRCPNRQVVRWKQTLSHSAASCRPRSCKAIAFTSSMRDLILPPACSGGTRMDFTAPTASVTVLFTAPDDGTGGCGWVRDPGSQGAGK
jgi:hypothetical protein